MPLYESHKVLQISGRIKAFLNLKVGVTLDGASGTKGEVERNPTPERAEKYIEQQRQQLQERDQKLGRFKERLEKQDKQMAQLRRKLEAKDSGPSSEGVLYDGVFLPPRNLRPCGASFQDDEFYLSSAKRDARKLVEHLGLTEDTSLLDMGSGPGRLAIGILEEVGEIRAYRGVDVSEPSIRWGQGHVTSRYPDFRFLHIDVENPRYNPSGKSKDHEFRFPFEDGEFDLICLYSVFTHMLTEGVRAYLKDFRRLLRPEGSIFLTAFVERGVPDVSENPEGYLGKEWKGRLHCVRYDQDYFESLLNEEGFRLDSVEPRSEKKTPNDAEQGKRGLYITRIA